MGASLRLYLSREARRGVPRGYDADRPRAPAPAPRNEPRKRRRCGGERRARHRSRGACRPAPLPVRLRLRACAQARLPSAPVARAARATRPATTVGGSAGRTPAANESPTGARCPWRVSQRRAGGARCLARHLGRAPRRAAPRRAAPPASPAPRSGVHPPSLTARSSAAAGGRPLEERCRRARARGYFWKFQSLIISHQALQVQLGPVPPRPPGRSCSRSLPHREGVPGGSPGAEARETPHRGIGRAFGILYRCPEAEAPAWHRDALFSPLDFRRRKQASKQGTDRHLRPAAAAARRHPPPRPRSSLSSSLPPQQQMAALARSPGAALRRALAAAAPALQVRRAGQAGAARRAATATARDARAAFGTSGETWPHPAPREGRHAA